MTPDITAMHFNPLPCVASMNPFRIRSSLDLPPLVVGYWSSPSVISVDKDRECLK